MPTSRPSLLELHHAAGDASLGQTLLRLARLAAAIQPNPHKPRQSDARSAALGNPTNAPRDNHHVPRTHGRVRGQEFLAAPYGGSVRKESNR